MWPTTRRLPWRKTRIKSQYIRGPPSFFFFCKQKRYFAGVCQHHNEKNRFFRKWPKKHWKAENPLENSMRLEKAKMVLKALKNPKKHQKYFATCQVFVNTTFEKKLIFLLKLAKNSEKKKRGIAVVLTNTCKIS